MKCPACGFENADGMNFCGKCGTKLQPIHTEQRKFATVLYADLKGYTALAEKRDPEEMSEILRQLYARFDEVLNYHRAGFRDFIGDAVMALFGVPTTYGDDARNACHAALTLQTEIAKFSREVSIPLALRIGINAGEVVYSTIAPLKKTVTGDTINTAQRLQTVAEPGTIILSWSVARLIQERFQMEKLPPLTLKGKTEKVVAFRLIRPLESESRRPVPFIDRQQEIRKLNDSFVQMKEAKKACTVMLAGESGIGKSELVAEFVRSHSTCNFYITRSTHSRDGTFRPLGDLVRFLLKLEDDNNDRKTRTAVLDGTRDLVGKNPNAHHFIGFFLDLKFADSPLQYLTPEQVRQEAFATLVNLIETYSATTPLLYCIENLHNCDRGTKDFLEFISDVGCHGQFMVLITGWIETYISELHEHKRKSWENWRIIEINRLDNDSSYALIAALLKGKAYPGEIANLLIKRGGGNPLFYREFVRELLELNVLIEEEKRFYLASPLVDLTLPDNLRMLLESRVDRLPEGQREILKHAAVVGNSFWHSMLKGFIEKNLDENLVQLEEKGYVKEIKPSRIRNDREYLFQHNLLREVAYQILLKRARKELHKEILNRLKEMDQRDKIPYRLYLQLCASNCEGAEFYRDAIEFYRRLGDELDKHFAMSDAHAAYSKALELVCANPNEVLDEYKAGLYEARARLSQFLCLFDDAIRDFEHLSASQYPQNRIVGYLGLASVYDRIGNFDKAIDNSLMAASNAERFNFDKYQAQALNLCGLAHWRKGMYGRALQLVNKAVQINTVSSKAAQKAGKEELRDVQKGIAACYNSLGTIYFSKGNLDEAKKAYEKSLFLFEQIGEIQKIAAVFSNIGTIFSEWHDYEHALQYYKKGLKLRTDIGHRYGIAMSQNNIAVIHSYRAEYARALNLYHTSLETRRAIGDKTGIASTLNNIGTIHMTTGDYLKALAAFEKSLAIYEETGNKYGMVICLNNISRIHSFQMDWSHALSCQKRAERIAREMDVKKLIIATLNVQGEIHIYRDKPEKAIDVLREAINIGAVRKVGPDIGLSYALMAEALLARTPNKKVFKAAEDYLRRARRIGKKFDNDADIARSLSTYISLYELGRNYKKAYKKSEELLSLVKEKNLQGFLPDAYFLKGKLLRRLNDLRTAASLLEKARSLAQQRGQRRLLTQIDRFLQE